jgi:hypothetical protein
MKMLKMSLNWKVLASLAAVGVGIYLVAPDLVLAALPLLLLAACPLSMLLMMLTMKDMQEHQGEAREPGLSRQNDTDLTREEQIAQLRAQHAALAEQIDSLERSEPRPSPNGSERDNDRTTNAGKGRMGS